MTQIEKLLLKLLNIPSVSGQEEKIGQFIISQLSDFEIQKQYIDKSRFNVIAKKGKSNTWIVAHMDTVPGTVPIRVTSDKIYGRGSVDNKSNIATVITASKRIKNINFLFTVGEETDFCGAMKAQQIIRKQKAIIMEPTNFEIYTSQRGVVGFSIKCEGKQKHSALIKKNSENAFHNLVDILNAMIHKKWTAFNIGIMSGGTAINIVAGKASAIISIRPDDLKEYNEIKSHLAHLKKIKGIEIDIKNDMKPFVSKLKIDGKRKKAFTEMAFFPNSLLFGTGSLSLAHTAGEYVSRKSLNIAEKKLLHIINNI